MNKIVYIVLSVATLLLVAVGVIAGAGAVVNAVFAPLIELALRILTYS